MRMCQVVLKADGQSQWCGNRELDQSTIRDRGITYFVCQEHRQLWHDDRYRKYFDRSLPCIVFEKKQ